MHSTVEFSLRDLICLCPNAKFTMWIHIILTEKLCGKQRSEWGHVIHWRFLEFSSVLIHSMHHVRFGLIPTEATWCSLVLSRFFQEFWLRISHGYLKHRKLKSFDLSLTLSFRLLSSMIGTLSPISLCYFCLQFVWRSSWFTGKFIFDNREISLMNPLISISNRK